MPKVVKFSKPTKGPESARVVWVQWLMPADIMRHNDLAVGDRFSLKISAGARLFEIGHRQIGKKNFFFLGMELAEKLRSECLKSAVKLIRFEAKFSDPIISIESIGKVEGERRLQISERLERDRTIIKRVREVNKTTNGGTFQCETCTMRHAKAGLFDVHHLQPLSAGARTSQIDGFALLCPTCHRYAHVFQIGLYRPMSLADIRQARRSLKL